jgi:SWI/SNF-related matrix-associated actin-dependent regulator 1 of chromatin subfamily A
MTAKTPFPFQRYAIAKARAQDVTLLCLEQGLGKTMVAARALVPPCTIACPAFLQYNWIDEVEECGYSAVLVKEQADLFRDADVFVMSFHFLVNLDLDVVKANTFICDEFHYAKNLEAKRTHAVLAEIECIKKVMLLSGTPIPSRPVEIYPVLDAIGAYDRGYYSFVHRFCNARQTDYGLDVNGASNLDQLRDIIAPYMIRFTKKQVMKELPDKRYRVLSQDLQLPPEEKAYDVEEFKHVAPDVAYETLSTVMRLHAQIKFPSVCDIIDHHFETRGDKLIVFGHHRAEMLEPLLGRYAHLNPGFIAGGVSPKKKREQEQKFQNDETCRLIIIGILAGGVGLTLTAASRVLLAESSWVPGDIDQAGDRAHRIGQTSNVEVDIVTVRGSIDEYQIRRALEKRRITSQLITESELPTMDTEIITRMASIFRNAADELESLLADGTPDGEEEEKPTRTRRSRRSKADDDEGEEKPKRTRRSRAKKDDDDEGEEEKPTRSRRSRRSKADDDEGEEEKPTRTRRSRRSKADDDDEGEEEEKPTRSRRSRRSKKDDDDEGEEKPFDKVRTKASELLKATSREELNDLLAEFKAEKVSGLDEEDYEEFMAACDEIIAEAD